MSVRNGKSTLNVDVLEQMCYNSSWKGRNVIMYIYVHIKTIKKFVFLHIATYVKFYSEP